MAESISPVELTLRFESLLREYSSVTRQGLELSEPDLSRDRIEHLIEEHRGCYDKWVDGQRKNADNFNLLNALGVSRKEACHSKALAWLLDWRCLSGLWLGGLSFN